LKPHEHSYLILIPLFGSFFFVLRPAWGKVRSLDCTGGCATIGGGFIYFSLSPLLILLPFLIAISPLFSSFFFLLV
jgi:hypothetical protein